MLGGDLQGFPNGRRLGDDVVDIALQALEGAATNGIVKPLAAGDGVNANDHAFGKTFPYVAPAEHRGRQPGRLSPPDGPATRSVRRSGRVTRTDLAYQPF